jgi:hypothetical protein
MHGQVRRVRRKWLAALVVRTSGVRDRARDTDWNRLELNAIGSVWGRDRFGSQMSGGAGWSATIVAELTR